MNPVLTAAAMREADRFTIEELGIPGFTLMETAGRETVRYMEEAYGPLGGKRIVVLCGKGNNGGDGLVIGRVLAARGAVPDIICMGTEAELSDDARRNFAILRNILDEQTETGPGLEVIDDPSGLPSDPHPDIIVDALLGTGLSKPLKDPIAEWVRWANEQNAFRVAIDVPTGLNSDTGEIMGTAFDADLTVTMGALKCGLVIGDGPEKAGAVRVADIGIPPSTLQAAASGAGCALNARPEEIGRFLPKRPRDAHKYTAGLVVSVTGSRQYPGAAVLASTAAARAGAGAVVCAAPKSIREILQQKFTEIMTFTLPETVAGTIARDALQSLDELLGRAKSVIVGCGLGRDEETQDFVLRLLGALSVPAVVDADALNAIAGKIDRIPAEARRRLLLTPHMGEFKRLTGGDVPDFINEIEMVRHFADAWGVTLLLKGNPSLVATPEGAAYVSTTGHPALASAGTGDVLSGLCGGLLAQGLDPAAAALCALELGGNAARAFSRSGAPGALLASDLLPLIPLVTKELESYSR